MAYELYLICSFIEKDSTRLGILVQILITNRIKYVIYDHTHF
jgi:hypothetical protein